MGGRDGRQPQECWGGTWGSRMGGYGTSLGMVCLALRVRWVPREVGSASLPLAQGSKPQPMVPGGGCRGSGVSQPTRAASAPAEVPRSGAARLSPTVLASPGRHWAGDALH